jgi:stearoyl-CoA desaturase (delta-9 desaturase)
MATTAPPITPKVDPVPKSVEPTQFFQEPDHPPADATIPDSYVSYALKHQKALPPVTWENVFQNLNWLNVGILGLTPLLGFTGAYYTCLRWETAVWAIVYYYMTGFGPCPFFHRGRS